MDRSRLPLRIVGALLLVVLAGCQKSISPAPGRVDPLINAPYPQIALLDSTLEEHLAFDQPIVDRDGSSVEVTVPLRSLWRDRLWIQYRFLFLDSRGVMLEQDPDWRRLTLEPQASRQVQGVALQSRAADWRLEIRPAR